MGSFVLQMFVADVSDIGPCTPCISVNNLLMCLNSSLYGRPEDSEDDHKLAKRNANSAWDRHKEKTFFRNAKKAKNPLTKRSGPVLVQHGQLIALINCLDNSAGELGWMLASACA